MVNATLRLKQRWQALAPAVREGLVIAAAMLGVWLLIERTETCDRFFAYVEDNPALELDSAIWPSFFPPSA